MRKMRLSIIVLITILVLIPLLAINIGCADKGANSGEKQLYTCGMHPEVIRDKPGLCPICNMKLVPMKLSTGGAQSESGERKVLYYTDPMDPAYISDKPGKSPMGMDLVPVYEDQVMSGTGVTIDPTVIQNIGVKYAKVSRGALVKSIRAAAHVDYDEDNLSVLSVRADGWIEKLYVTSVGTSVKAGDPLFEFYSPKLYSAREEYRIALRSKDTDLIHAARERLRLLGISDSQIESMAKSDSSRTITIFSPSSGSVVSIGTSSQSAGTSSGGGAMTGMGDSSGSSGGARGGMNTGSGATIREGDYVSSGTAVFTIADLSTLWIYAHIYEDELPYVKKGMRSRLELEYIPDENFEGTIDFIYPFLDKQTRDIKIRVTMPNPDGKLLPEMYGRLLIESEITSDSLLVPTESIIFSGDKRIALLALPAGRFLPVDVTVGASDGKGNTQIVEGLAEGQTVVTSAQFLIDSESRLKEALNQMLASSAGAKAGTSDKKEATIKEPSEETKEWPNLAPDDPRAKFRCPMPVDRYYAESEGDCPICGMGLEPHDPAKWTKEHSN